MKNGFTKTTVKSIAFAAFAALSINAAIAQSQQEHHCGSTEQLERLYQQYPGLEQQTMDKHAQSWEEGKRTLANDRSSSPPTYIIPVVFHIVHDYGTENISDAQIFDQMRILNEDFRKLNADTSQIVAPFDSLAADCQIEFRLAQLDPEGQCTNGIERIRSMETYVGDDGSKLNQWPRDKYLNIWVVKDMEPGVGGYAYFPAAVDGFLYMYDGVMIRHNVIGSIGTSNPTSSRSLSHEIGHFLSLPHVWGFNNVPGVLCGDDGIFDTPQTKGWGVCELVNNQICVTGVPENVQNYMEYAFCQRMFTFGQRDAMHYALNSSISDRNNLWSQSNLAATGCLNTQPVCAPHADFLATETMVCEGSPVTFYDTSWSHAATSWSWTISGPATFTSTLENPTFTFTAPGHYDVTLVASNASGSTTVTRNDYLLVSPAQAMVTAQYTEGFESPNVFFLGYESNNRYGNGSYFQQTTWASYTGTGSAVLNTFNNSIEGDIDELITPSYDLRFNTNMQLSFKYAYATASTQAALNTQKFTVYSSVDCGATWSQRWTVNGSSVATAGYNSSFFAPANNQQLWEIVTINLPPALAQANVRFKFVFVSPQDDVGNNLYIDDINILGSNVGINEPAEEGSFGIYPNPGDGNSTIAYTLTEAANVKCDIFDISGRLISSVNKGEQGAGNYTMPLNENGTLAPGTYMVQMTIGDKVSTRKYVSASHE
jgi:PKD repeat protein